ncbi:MAG: sodium:glutamate symporter [Verrucomicrobiae bacterium]|nr:sodium:glutamate symporter [Verrucomicrobiae bacterium]
MILSAWWTIILALPVLWLGEFLVRRVRLFSRFQIPAPVVGGLIVSLVIWGSNVTQFWTGRFDTKIAAPWWTWLVTIEPDWLRAPAQTANLPFLVMFFTCIGLNASWSLVKRGSLQVLLFLAIAGLLAIIQNGFGVVLAQALGQSPLLGLVCGSVSMTGGHGTALGFAADLERAGLPAADVLGMAAATFGLVAGGLIGGPIGGGLIRRFNLKSTASTRTHLEAGESGTAGILSDFRALFQAGRTTLPNLALLLVCVKLGAWVSWLIQMTGLTFPIYMGAMLLGVTVRNGLDFAGVTWVKTEIIDTLAAISLGLFLSVALMSLNLIELARAAGPMLVILSAQVFLMALFAWWVTYRLMGRDFEAAVMAGGHCGFGLGATPNAVANMKALVEKFGPAPRAFLVLPIVGAFLIDFINALNITVFLNLFKQ